MRIFLIVLDSVGIGEAPDATSYGDNGANTLAHVAEYVHGIHVPTLESWGLGNIPVLLPNGKMINGVKSVPKPLASFGAMREVSHGKDTTTGHWEIAGIEMEKGFTIFPPAYPSFPSSLIDEFSKRTGRKVIGNYAASGTVIIQELGEEHMKTGAWIVYTSADSVLQIAAHEEVIPLPELYEGCKIARELANPLRIGRIIARPFIGEKAGSFKRTDNRRDFSMPLPEPSILNMLADRNIPIASIGKIDDIFPNIPFSPKYHVENNKDAMSATLQIVQSFPHGLVFINFIDFDMLYGHRRDAAGYAKAIEEMDAFIKKFSLLINDNDMLIVTADHGNDPVFRGTDHTREYVPLLVFGHSVNPRSLGIRNGFFDVAASVASFFNIKGFPRGKSFISSFCTK